MLREIAPPPPPPPSLIDMASTEAAGPVFALASVGPDGDHDRSGGIIHLNGQHGRADYFDQRPAPPGSCWNPTRCIKVRMP